MLGKITRASLGVSRLFGYNEDELIGRNIKQLMPQPYSRNHEQFIQNFKDEKPAGTFIGRDNELFA